MLHVKEALCTALAIPTSEPTVIECPDGKQIVLCDAGAAAWYNRSLPCVSIRNPGLGYLPVYLLVDRTHANVLTLSFKDTPETSLQPHLEKACEFMRQYDTVLVHCRMGRSRSAAIVVAYIMRTYNYSFEQALGLVQGARPEIRINPGFIEQLKSCRHF